MRKTETAKIDIVVERLRELRLGGMADMLKAMKEDGSISSESAQKVLDCLTNQEELIRRTRKTKRLLRSARLYYPSANIPGIIQNESKKLNTALLDSLLTCEYISGSQPVWVLGSSGTGKTYISSVLGNQACILQYSVRYFSTSEFFQLCAEAELNGEFKAFLCGVCKKNLIILDDFLLTGVTFSQATYLFELLNHPVDPKHPRSIMISSQLMEEEMKLRLAEVSPSLAEAIMSRLKSKRLVLVITGKDMRAN